MDADRLETYCSRVPELREFLPIEAIERVGHGQSNLTFRVTFQNATAILRRPPSGPLPPRAHDVLREAFVLSRLQPSDVPVPRVLHACSDTEIIGTPFFLMENLQGDALRFDLPSTLAATPTAPQAISRLVVDALATLHSTDPASVGLENLSRPSGYLGRQLGLWKTQLQQLSARATPELDWTAQWLELRLPDEAGRTSIIHGDYKLDNCIFASDPPPRLSGIVDWEMAALGDPLSDLGWLLAFWCKDDTPPRELSILPWITDHPSFPRRDEIVARYAARTGRKLGDLQFYVVLALWKMAVVLEGHWARHVRGTASAFDFQYLETAGPVFAAYIQRVAEDDPPFYAD